MGAIAALAVGIVALWWPVATEAMCCACKGGACGAGFCVDGVADTLACSHLCVDAGCGSLVYHNSDSCDLGCDVAGPLPSATPSSTPTATGTPTDTPTPSPTPSSTATVPPTPTITRTPTITPTPVQCCQCADTNSCGQPVMPSTCAPGCTLHHDASCDSRVGGQNLCLTNTPTRTFTLTPTITPTATATATVTASPTRTDTPKIPSEIDPYKCYRIKRQDRVPARTVTLIDQFENKRTAVLKPFLLCNPALRRSASPLPTKAPPPGPPTAGPSPTPTPLPLEHPQDHLVCYRIRDSREASQPKFRPVQVKVRNEVEPGVEVEETYEVLKPDLICLPSVTQML